MIIMASIIVDLVLGPVFHQFSQLLHIRLCPLQVHYIVSTTLCPLHCVHYMYTMSLWLILAYRLRNTCWERIPTLVQLHAKHTTIDSSVIYDIIIIQIETTGQWPASHQVASTSINMWSHPIYNIHMLTVSHLIYLYYIHLSIYDDVYLVLYKTNIIIEFDQ